MMLYREADLVGLGHLCHYTPSHTPSGRCLLCLQEGRSFSPTAQSHYGLSVTPSFLLGCSQDGITRVYYRPVSAKLWLRRDNDMCRPVCLRVHTHTWTRRVAGRIGARLFSIAAVCLRHRGTRCCVVHVGCHDTRLGVRRFRFKKMGIRNSQKITSMPPSTVSKCGNSLFFH